MEVVLLVISFAVILAGALLFTNAIEWIGHRLGRRGGRGRAACSPRSAPRCPRR